MNSRNENILTEYAYNIDYNKLMYDYAINLINLALERTGGNQFQAAKLLGISRGNLRARLSKSIS